jgi:protein TonB
VVVALLFAITAFQLRWTPEDSFQVDLEQQEVVKMKEITQTTQANEPPPPPRPPAPVEAPNNTTIQQEDINFDASLDLDQELNVADDPPPPDEDPDDEEEEDDEQIFVAVEQQPDCGGLETLQKKAEYPKFARQAGIEGRVIVQFVVDEQGTVTDPTVIRSVHRLLDQAAVRAVQKLNCTPGMQRNTPVKVRLAMPVVFRLKDRPR